MLHASFAARCPVGFKEPFLGPTQSEAVGHDVVDLLSRRHAILDEPEGLSPDGLQQAISDVSGNFGF